MTPRDTRYRLAHSPRDYGACRALLRAQGQDAPLSFPTVLAERHGTLLGFLATQQRHDAVVAGPLAVVPGTSPIVVMRLVESYENVLRTAGVRAFWFHVDAANAGWRRLVEKLGLAPARVEPDGAWYRRRVA